MKISSIWPPINGERITEKKENIDIPKLNLFTAALQQNTHHCQSYRLMYSIVQPQVSPFAKPMHPCHASIRDRGREGRGNNERKKESRKRKSPYIHNQVLGKKRGHGRRGREVRREAVSLGPAVHTVGPGSAARPATGSGTHTRQLGQLVTRRHLVLERSFFQAAVAQTFGSPQ